MLNDFIEQICDTFRDAICVSDRDGKVLLVNRRHSARGNAAAPYSGSYGKGLL